MSTSATVVPARGGSSHSALPHIGREPTRVQPQAAQNQSLSSRVQKTAKEGLGQVVSDFKKADSFSLISYALLCLSSPFVALFGLVAAIFLRATCCKREQS